MIELPEDFRHAVKGIKMNGPCAKVNLVLAEEPRVKGMPPDASGKKLAFDDFTHQAGTWTLTAHEARPGHELQFAKMIEMGVSTARGRRWAGRPSNQRRPPFRPRGPSASTQGRR